MHAYLSWGRYPRVAPSSVVRVRWQSDPIPFDTTAHSFLPYGYGRSYGDACLNDGGIVLDASGLRRFVSFDCARGILRCEAGVSLADILALVVPRGWFLPVTPGTKYVSIGGAIANDVHGKNHHRAGTFGRHVRCFELLRSTGERLFCSPTHNSDFFQATIGGLGLTGLILWAEIQLRPIVSPWIDVERIPFANLTEFFRLSADADRNFEYTVAWIDCAARKTKRGRGIFIRGNHQPIPQPLDVPIGSSPSIRIPASIPLFVLAAPMLEFINGLYYHLATTSRHSKPELYDPFFYPLDKIRGWNRLYGKPGFLQYQCVISPPHHQAGIEALLECIHRARQGSFLAVLKQFGPIASPGMLSFPREGTTLALDFPFRGRSTLELLNDLDTIVRECKGAVYPAKDARMSPQQFQACFPRWTDFLKFRDPKFSSSFWRRVVPDLGPDEPSAVPIAGRQASLVAPVPELAGSSSCGR